MEPFKMIIRSIFPSKFLLACFCVLFVTSGADRALAADEVSVTDIPVRINQFQFSEMTSYRATDGRFDPYGYYTALPTGSSSTSIAETLSTSYRFSKELEFSFSLPLRRSVLSLPTGSTTTTSVGGASFSGRYHL